MNSQARDTRDTSLAIQGLNKLTGKQFDKLSLFIHTHVGIKLPPAKKTMLESRLQKRVRVLNLSGFDEYCTYLFSDQGMENELQNLIDSVTTNTTDFFREPKHFDLLTNHVLPNWLAEHSPSATLRIWSAGCSVGMEPYTLAMVLSEFKQRNPGFRFSILATDISNQALAKAARGVYEEERVDPVPLALKKKYLLRGKGKSAGLVRVCADVRKCVEFRWLNFMEGFTFKKPMDIIFCRNVIIYFDRPTQEKLFGKFCQHLAKGGHLFIGHSESLAGMDLPLCLIAPTVYQRT